jgi:NAD(P)H dehydrogenase (quinone)
LINLFLTFINLSQIILSSFSSKVLVILASPNYDQDRRSETINSLCKIFVESCQARNVMVDLVDLYKETDFNPIFLPENKDTKSLEYQIRLKKADTVVFFYPVWWGTVPAILKGFLDKVLLPGFAFETEKSATKGLLEKKKLMVFCTTEKPVWEHNLLYGNINKIFWKRVICNTCDMTLTKFMEFGSIRNVNSEEIQKWKNKIQKIVQGLDRANKFLDNVANVKIK